MNRNVLHFVRKTSQLKATFISDQISKHINYFPFVIAKEKVEKIYDGGFADFDLTKYKLLLLEDGRQKSYKYRIFKKISEESVNRILAFIKENNINILHFHYGTDAGLYYEVMKKSGLPSVVSFYGYESSSFPKMYFGLGKYYLRHRVFKNATKVFAMSKDMEKDFIKLGCKKDKIKVHYYGVDGKIYYYPERKYLEKSKLIILDVCSLVPQKGHLFLLESIKKLVSRGASDFEVRIVGTGELEQKLKNYVSENNLSDYATFLGAMKAHSEEILNEYRNADIFTHPSVIPENGDKEGIPGTIVEAMFSGLPVVSTYHAGIPYIIENGKTGLLVEEMDTDKLAENILKLINDVYLREKTGRAGQEYAYKNLDLKIKEEELENIYDSLI